MPAIPPPILLVEDDDNDVVLMRRAFEAAQVRNPVFVAYDGQHAMELLESIHMRPCLVITDIKMPKVGGFELLVWLQSQPELREVPKLVVSSSVLEEDLAKSLDLGATAYFIKPNSHHALIELVRQWKETYLERADST